MFVYGCKYLLLLNPLCFLLLDKPFRPLRRVFIFNPKVKKETVVLGKTRESGGDWGRLWETEGDWGRLRETVGD